MTPQLQSQVERLRYLYDIARKNGLVKNKGEFAELIGTLPGTLSYAFQGTHGRVNVGNLIIKAENVLQKKGVDITEAPAVQHNGDNSMQNVSGSNNTIGLPVKNFEHESRLFELIAAKDKQIDKLLAQQADFLALSKSLTVQNQLLIEKLTK